MQGKTGTGTYQKGAGTLVIHVALWERVEAGSGSLGAASSESAAGSGRPRVRGGFLYKLGVVSYTIRILMYPACILHVS